MSTILSKFKTLFSRGGSGRGGEERERDAAVEKRGSISDILDFRLTLDAGIIFVGGLKGGSGKSFISAQLALLASVVSSRSVIAVDSDVQNMTMTMRLLGSYYDRLVSMRDVDSTASILARGIPPRETRLLNVKHKVYGCNGGAVRTSIAVLPAVHPARLRVEQQQLALLDEETMRVNMIELLRTLRRVSEDKLIIIDGKQKGIGVRYEPIYSGALDVADVYIHVSDFRAELSFERETAQLRDYLGKMIYIINKVPRDEYRDTASGRILTRNDIRRIIDENVRAARRYGVPVFIIPHNPREERRFLALELPAQYLNEPSVVTPFFVLALLMFMNLYEADPVRCAEKARRKYLAVKKLNTS